MSGALETLRSACGADAVLDDPSLIESYATDWRGVYKGQALAVVRPATLDQLVAAVRACANEGLAMVPQGGNTGLAAGATPLGLSNAVIVSLSRMNRVRSVDAAGFSMAVDAGCVLADVRERADAAGRLFPLSLAAEGSAQIGGLISTNAGGTSVLRYGTMRSLVLGLEVVLPDGTVLSGMRALRKDNAGYDWKQLFIGAEGTLGIVSGAVLRLAPQPRSSGTALAGIHSLDDAIRVFEFLSSQLGEALSAFEFFPDRAVALRIAHHTSIVRAMPEHPWYLLIEATSAFDLDDAFPEALAHAVEAGFIGDVVVATSASQAHELWLWRESITEEERRAGPSAKHDVSVAISDVPAFVRDAAHAVEATFDGAWALPFGHIGDGNVHFNVITGPRGEREAITELVHEIVRRYNGSITAEHGIGRYRRDDLRLQRGEAELDIMRAVKQTLDPHGLMNPGAIF